MAAMKTKTGSQLCPHVCKCGSACYRGAYDIECVNPLCHWYSEKTLIAFQREYMKGERSKAADLYSTDFSDEPTQPQQKDPATLYGDVWKQYVNAWAPMLGVKKLAGESDDHLRDRILDKLGYKPGAKMIPVIKGID